MRPSLNLVTLGVADLEKSIAFYRDGLGWKTASEASEGVAFFQLGPIILSLFPLEKLAEDAQVPSGGTGFSGITLAHNTRTKEEVDDVMRTAKKAGAAIMKPAQDVFWGGYSGYFADPDGHLWEVAWNPFWTMTDDGRILLPSSESI